MYRSRMATTRQTLSMDCGNRDKSSLKIWDGPGKSEIDDLYLQPSKNEESLDMALGASASRVHSDLQMDNTLTVKRETLGKFENLI